MDSLELRCWSGVFMEAYKYSSTYLIFSLTLILASVFMAWINDNPRLYKMIFKRSIPSEVSSPVISGEVFAENGLQNLDNYTNALEKLQEICKDVN